MEGYKVLLYNISTEMPVNRDTPEKIRLKETLRDYEMRYRTMAEHVSMGMFQLSRGPEGRVLSTNRVMPRLLGYDRPEDLIGKRMSELLILPGDFDELATEIMQEGSVAGREIRLKRKEGSEIWVSVQAWKLLTPDHPERVIEGFVEDVTERRVFEQEMHYHESELNRYALALSQVNKKLNLLSNITRHDILNKLTGLQGYLELMKEGSPNPPVRDYLRIQEEIIQTIALQIRFTKDYQDIGVETPRWFDLRETIRTTAATLAIPSVTVTVEAGDLWIYADPMLEKVFYNLVENALRHGGNLTRITFRVEVSGDTAWIICEDDGEGVPEQFKEAIFVRKHFKHTGFGLFLSREILGITGLTIRENGEPGNGARFEITIPTGYFRTGDAPR